MSDTLKKMKLLLCLLLTVGYIGAIKFRCDYSYNNAGWFKYHEVPATWKDARLRCRFEGGMLASPTTSAIKEAMLNAMRDVDIFTGIHATVSPGSYYTIDGIPLSAIHPTWADKEPDNKNDAERCIAFNAEGKFSDVRCNIPHPYICYRPSSSPGAGICGTPDAEYRFDSRTNKCYKFHTTPRQFKRAHFVCSAEGGHLAIINSETEYRVIQELFAKYPHQKMIGNFWKDIAFLGFHTYDESADWTTLEGQTLVEAGFARFKSGEPNNFTTGEYCGAVYRNEYLDDLWCENHYAFICEKKADFPAVCDSNDFNEESL